MIKQINLNNKEILKTVLKNVVKMFTERGNLSRKNLEKNIKKLTEQKSDKNVYSIHEGTFNLHIYIPKNKLEKSNDDYRSFLDNNSDHHRIIVSSIPFTSRIKKFLKENDIEYFEEAYFMMNIIDHIDVPEHILLPKSEHQKVFDQYNCDKDSMPLILSKDPICRYYGAKNGDMFRIIRNSQASGKTIIYRYVVDE